MANQKISQLTEQTDLSLIDGLAGYEGTSNVRISGPNIISAIPTIYSGDGTLTANRTVTQNGFDVFWSGGEHYFTTSAATENFLNFRVGTDTRAILGVNNSGGSIFLTNSSDVDYFAAAPSAVDIDPEFDVRIRPGRDTIIEPTGSGKIQVKQSNFQWNGTGSQTYIRSSNLPDFYHLMPDSNVYFNLYSDALAPNGKSFIGWIGGSVQFITGHPSNATHGGQILLTSKGSTATLQTFNAANWGTQSADIDPGGIVKIDSAAEDVQLNVREYGSIKVGTDLVGSVTQPFIGANNEPFNQLKPGVTSGVTTNGSGTGLVLEMDVAGGVATRIRVSNATSNSQSGWNSCQGQNFEVGDTITFAASTYGGSQDMIITLTESDLTPAYIDLNGPIKQQGLATLSGTTPSWDIRANYNAELTIDAAGSALTIQGALAGDYGTVIVDSSASTSLTFPAGSVYPGGTAPTLTGTANKDVLSFLYDGTNYYWTSALDFS